MRKRILQRILKKTKSWILFLKIMTRIYAYFFFLFFRRTDLIAKLNLQLWEFIRVNLFLWVITVIAVKYFFWKIFCLTFQHAFCDLLSNIYWAWNDKSSFSAMPTKAKGALVSFYINCWFFEFWNLVREYLSKNIHIFSWRNLP